jgi:hypothetical protein
VPEPASVALAIATLGLRLAQLVIRSGGLESASDWADLVGDARDSADAASKLHSRLRRTGADQALGNIITIELEKRLRGIPLGGEDRVTDLAVAAERVARLIGRLASQPDAIRVAAARPSQFHAYALTHGGERLIWTTEDHASPFAEKTLEVACALYTELVLRTDAFPPAALQGLLRLADSLPAMGRVTSATHQIVSNPVTGIRAQADALTAQTDAIAAQADAITAQATADEVVAYLRDRLVDWDRSVWGNGPEPSRLERTLRVKTRGNDSEQLTSSEALNGAVSDLRSSPEGAMGSNRGQEFASTKAARMLVVLGGPGSGKSWLARRYAREAALTALRALESGAKLSEVEIPLLTTWSRWAEYEGPPQASLVRASFSSSSGHTPAQSDSARLRIERRLLDSETRVLAIVDSLDEASQEVRQDERLWVLSHLPGWRVVVTSRIGAWEETTSHFGLRGAAIRVAELEPLQYPRDVEAFIRLWFVERAAEGERLVAHLRTNRTLARAATIPLLLTFYCLISENPRGKHGSVLPILRRDLFDEIIVRLLLGRWTRSGPKGTPDVPMCRRLLTTWAWQSVNSDTTGASWGESFEEPEPPPQQLAQPLDNVAPYLNEDDLGIVLRKFVHRTIQEHLVAEYIGSLPTHEAEGFLLGHLNRTSGGARSVGPRGPSEERDDAVHVHLYDVEPEWGVAFPAAIAAHNRSWPGELIRRILLAYPTVAREIPSRDALLLAIAAHSGETEWSVENREVIHAARLRWALESPNVVALSGHWAASTARIVEIGVARLEAEPAASGVLSSLSTLAVTPDERQRVRAKISTSESTILSRAPSLAALAITQAERDAARSEILKEIPGTNAWTLLRLVPIVHSLGLNVDERRVLRSALIDCINNCDPSKVQRLGSMLVYATSLTECDLAAALLIELRREDASKFARVRAGIAREDFFSGESLVVQEGLLLALRAASG